MPSDSSDHGANKDDDADTSDCAAAGMHATPATAKSRSIKLFVVLWF